jgi:PhnB protein
MAKRSKKKPAKKASKKAAPKKAAKRKAAPKKKAVKKIARKKPAPKKAAASAKSGSASNGKKPAPAPVKRTVAIAPYLTFSGNCEDAFNFYRSVFGGNFTYVGRFKEMPPAEGQPPMNEETGKLIMHISLPIGNGSTLMGSDSSAEFGGPITAGNNFSISVNATSQAEADKLYNGLAAGGNAFMPMSKTFWGSYFGMCTDKFGIGWMVSYDERPM